MRYAAWKTDSHQKQFRPEHPSLAACYEKTTHLEEDRTNRRLKTPPFASIYATAILLCLTFAAIVGSSATAASVVCIDVSTGQRVSGAIVTVSHEGHVVAEVETGPEGLAALPEMTPGIYVVRVEKSGYLDLQDLQRRSRRLRLPLMDGAVHAYVLQTAVITGRVSDSEGRAISGAKVSAVVRRGTKSKAGLIEFGITARSDDRGAYRLHGLPPGHYSVVALPAGGDVAAEPFMPTFYGSGGAHDAEFLRLMPGDARSSVDLTISRLRPVSLSGTISGMPPGVNRGKAAVGLVAGRGIRTPIAAVLTDSEGAYRFVAIPPGDYTVTAWAPFQGLESNVHAIGKHGRTAARSISLNSSTGQIDLELSPLVQVEGQIVSGNENQKNSGCRGIEPLTFLSDDAWFGEWKADLSPDGKRFTVSNMPAGTYRIQAPNLEGCRLSVRQGSEAAPSGAVRLEASASVTAVLSAETGEVSGQVRSEDGTPPVSGFVLLVREDETGHLDLTPIDGKGRYQFHDAHPGTYRLAAVERVDLSDIMDPFAVSSREVRTITVEAGKSLKEDIRMMRR